ncbi:MULTISPECIES: hypothetical protein [Methylobacterium]|uniref:Uncharacterized protein n=2 Tax=Methylobacterium TaxID=407 RepID=A0A0C6FKB0_9HYPH|nr:MULTISPECIES: hypothetical protein [Methylobacterium]MBK3399992.1 hypothetical protein [Methylobacterium ajmalii]MBK3411129.1 hypothetical protein [Methylobacterium ajmalii]MBZ6412749.1 hypothetical protein [Methylobacterium sp.]SFF26865.1 hypothetical protein SAMN04487844_11330 [Methylobacterium sp. yr596]BAQ47532.1 hypothetical protein Maq22A_c22810 [Methylobacterium aquaticum]
MSQLKPGFALAALLALAACQSKTAAPPVAAVAPVAALPAAGLPAGSGCGPAIARTQTIVDSDVATGNLNAPVGKRFSADLANAAAACAAGRDGEALHLLAAARARYGYPG